jgi:hypothetical protein
LKVQDVKRKLQLQEWASQINEQKQSGMTVHKWCEANGLGYKNFYYRMRKVQEELLEALEAQGNNSKTSALAVLNNKQVAVKNKTPEFAPITIPQSKGAALTVWIGTYAVDVQNGADTEIIDQVLRTVSRL